MSTLPSPSKSEANFEHLWAMAMCIAPKHKLRFWTVSNQFFSLTCTPEAAPPTATTEDPGEAAEVEARVEEDERRPLRSRATGEPT